MFSINAHYSSASRGCHAVLQKLRPIRKRAKRYTVLNSPARNEELPYRAPKATQVDRSSVRSDTSRELSALRAHAHMPYTHCIALVHGVYNPRPFLFRLCHRQKSEARDTNVAAHAQP